MLLQLLIGTVVVSLTIIVIAAFIGAAIYVLTKIGNWFVSPPQIYKSLLSGICAANGLLLFRLSTAFLVEFFRRLTEAQSKRAQNPR